MRRDTEIRLRAFDLLNQLKNNNIERKDIIDIIHNKFGMPIMTLYDWYRGKYCPFGRRESIIYRPELFYALGALLRDGCPYKWKITYNYTILVGNKMFATKFANRLNQCTYKKVKPYINRSKNI